MGILHLTLYFWCESRYTWFHIKLAFVQLYTWTWIHQGLLLLKQGAAPAMLLPDRTAAPDSGAPLWPPLPRSEARRACCCSCVYVRKATAAQALLPWACELHSANPAFVTPADPVWELWTSTDHPEHGSSNSCGSIRPFFNKLLRRHMSAIFKVRSIPFLRCLLYSAHAPAFSTHQSSAPLLLQPCVRCYNFMPLIHPRISSMSPSG